MLEPRRTVAPAARPVSLGDMKSYLRVDHDDENPRIEEMIAAATAKIDGYHGELGRALITQTWRVDYDRFPADRRLELPIDPIIAIDVKYSDADNVEQTLSPSSYSAVVDSRGAFVQILDSVAGWPATYDRPDAVRVTIVAGFGATGADVPEDLRHAIRRTVAYWFENREAGAASPITAG